MSNKKDIVQLIKSLFQRKILSKKLTEKKVQKDSFLFDTKSPQDVLWLINIYYL